MTDFGFKATSSRKDRLESTEPNFVTPARDPLRVHIGEAIKLRHEGEQAGGIYRGLTEDGWIVLQPSLVVLTIPRGWDAQNRLVCSTRMEWEEKRPKYIRYAAVDEITPESEEFLRAYSKNTVIEEDYSI
jgi:hypothetical protein